MSITLTKDVAITTIPGTPGSPGSPGTAPTAAYCVTTSRTDPSYTYKLYPLPLEYGQTVVQYQLMAVSGPSVTTYATTCYPATAGTPPTAAVAGTASVTTAQFNLGWNAGARSINTLAADGTASFLVGAGVIGAVVGLDSGAVEFSYAGAEHALYFRSGLVNVLESGETRTGSVPYLPADVFRIERSGSTVRYYQNATLLYTSSTPSYGTQYLEASMYSGGDTVIDASLTTGVTAGAGSSGNTALLPLAATGGDVEYSYGDTVMSPLGASAAGEAEQGGGAIMSGLQALGSDANYASGEATLAPVTSSGEAGTAPTYALGAAQLGYLGAGGYGLTSGSGGQGGGVMAPASAAGSDYAYAGGSAVLEPLTAFSTPLIPLSGWAFVAGPSPTMYAAAHDSSGENAANITAPGPTAVGYSGSAAGVQAPAATLVASAVGDNWLTARVTAPAGTLAASGIVAGTAQAGVTAPMATLAGYGGMVSAVTLTGKATVLAAVSSGSTAQASITAPMARLELFELTAEAYSRADILAPAGQMGATLQAWLVAPTGRLTAIGTAVVVASYEAYSINLTHAPRGRGAPEPIDEVTHYTNFPFTHIVRYRNSYFGVAADGLYLLEGTTDDGAAIPYAVRTCVDDFQTSEKKTAASAYFGGRLGPDATITVYAGEAGAESYAFSTPRGQLAQNHREKFGRGVKDRYLAIGVAGDGALELDNIDLDITKLSRRI